MTRWGFVAGVAVVGLVLAGCGGEEETPAGGLASQSAGAALSTAEVGSFGKVVVDGTDRTVYVFDKDTANPSKSNCDGECAAKWPPVLAGAEKPKVDGIDAALVGTVTRTDGSTQVTLAGWPLYQFAQDSKAGDAKGQAVGGVWWVVGADGKKITAKPPASNGNGYGY